MAKMNTRKGTPHSSPMPGSGGQQGLPSGPGPMAPGGSNAMGKPGMGSMGQSLHHHHAGGHPDAGAPGGGDEVGMFHHQM